MLSPTDRSVYTDALVPPDGFELDAAIALTYSMDLTTLLSVPLQLVLNSTEDHRELFQDPVTLFEALRRAASKVTVFVQQGGIHVPAGNHLLFGLLETMIVEVASPGGGAFHPKLWLLCFAAGDGGGVVYRLMLPSKNLTADRAWDLALTVEGARGERQVPGNDPLVALLRRLPDMAVRPAPSARVVAERFAGALEEIEWGLPEGFDSLRFHALGVDGSRWQPPANDRLVVISPFVRSAALAILGSTSAQPLAVIARSQELTELSGFAPFREAYVLHDAAETEDGEDAEGSGAEVGLHATAYLYEIGNRTHLVVGSANATDAALVAGHNVEVLAELAGPWHKVGRVKHLLEPGREGGLGPLLVPWAPGGDPTASPEQRANEKALDRARAALLDSEPALRCQRGEDAWQLELSVRGAPGWEGIDAVRGWPVTVGSERAVDLAGLAPSAPRYLPVQALASLTGLIAFEMTAGKERLAFVLNLPVADLPAERERAILRHVVNNREGFLRYLLLLLSGLGDGADVGAVARAFGKFDGRGFRDLGDDMPLLEEMVRAFARDPKRLVKVKELVEDLSADGGVEAILPPGFLEFWNIFVEALDGRA